METQPKNMNTNEQSTPALCRAIRLTIKSLAKEVATLKVVANLRPPVQPEIDKPPTEDRGEVLANITLAYRHLEDAAMRLGKAIQAYDGGVSVYDK